MGKGAPKGRKADSSRCVSQKGSEGQGTVRTAVHPSPHQHGKGGVHKKGLHWPPALGVPHPKGGGGLEKGLHAPPPSPRGLCNFPRAQARLEPSADIAAWPSEAPQNDPPTAKRQCASPLLGPDVAGVAPPSLHKSGRRSHGRLDQLCPPEGEGVPAPLPPSQTPCKPPPSDPRSAPGDNPGQSLCMPAATPDPCHTYPAAPQLTISRPTTSTHRSSSVLSASAPLPGVC